VLGRHGTCRICSEIAGDTSNVIGYAAQDTAPLAVEANRMTHTRTRIADTQGLWRPRAAPAVAAQTPNRAIRSPSLHCFAAAISWNNITSTWTPPQLTPTRRT
jgi:hypothetical protein